LRKLAEMKRVYSISIRPQTASGDGKGGGAGDIKEKKKIGSACIRSKR